MYNSIIATDNEQIRNECEKIIFGMGEIKVNYLKNINEVDLNGSTLNCLFILITEINNDIVKKIKTLQNNSPDLSVIFYNHSLTLSGLDNTGIMPDIKLIVGDNRRESLNDLLLNIKKNYWRVIPYKQLQIDYNALSPRIKKALEFIESSNISDCNIRNIASYLNISIGYFSQEFKRETGQSFRTFMQNILDYYESIIFSKINLPTKIISQLLGYSELSSFSRSFKKRKGISPSKYKKLVKI